MAEAVTMWRTRDGRHTFSTLARAEEYERTLDAAEHAMAPLINPERSLDSDEYIQQPPGAYEESVRRVIQWARESGTAPDLPDHWRPGGAYLERLLDDAGTPMARAVGKLQRIDDRGRMWQQPYYANHTPENPVEVGA